MQPRQVHHLTGILTLQKIWELLGMLAGLTRPDAYVHWLLSMVKVSRPVDLGPGAKAITMTMMIAMELLPWPHWQLLDEQFKPTLSGIEA